MTLTQALLGFAVVAVVLTIIPGLDTTLVLRTAIVSRRRRAVFAGLGVCAGALVWGVAAAAGAAALLSASELAYRMVSLVGAVYIAVLGVMMVVRGLRGSAPEYSMEIPPGSPWRSFGVGLMTNLLNPKVGVFYVATIPQFTPPDVSPLLMGALLALVHSAMTLVWFSLIIAAAGLARRWLARARSMRIIDGAAGTVLVGFGAALAAGQR